MLPRAHTDRTDLTGFSFEGGKSHGDSTVCGCCGLTRISQIPLFLLWVENLTEALRFVGVFGAHTDLTDPTLSFVGGKSHGGSTVCGFL